MVIEIWITIIITSTAKLRVVFPVSKQHRIAVRFARNDVEISETYKRIHLGLTFERNK